MSDHTTVDFVAYSMGLAYASVCTSLDDDAATARLNLEYPTGVAPWIVSADSHFADGINTNPCPCHDHPETHRHILFTIDGWAS